MFLKLGITVSGIAMLVLGVLLFPYNMTQTLEMFLNTGVEQQAMVTHKHTSIRTINTRYGPKSQDIFLIEVSFKSKESGQEKVMTIYKWVTENEHLSLKEGDRISVIYLPNRQNSKEQPAILLSSTVYSSFLKKIFLSFKGDITKSALGLILVIFGVGLTFSGSLLFYMK